MTTQADTKKTYILDGTLLEACSCEGPCPCWVGDDPDGGRCDSFNAYHIDRGQVGDVDVSNLSLVEVCQIPGNVLAGNWRAVFYLDDRATPEQREAILNVFSGKLGGPLADVAGLISERVAVHLVPIEHRVEGGKGTLRVGEVVEAKMTPYMDANGRPTTIHDTVFSTIPGSPAYLAKASHHQVNIPEYGMVWEFSGRNAIQGNFHFEA
jgi:hypothetical protein